MSERSEFGRGIVVCLAKFSEHLWNRVDPSMGFKEEKANLLAVRLGVQRKMHPEQSDEEAEAAVYSMNVEMWANGASDHFYDLSDKAPEPLKELASLTLKMGHGFTGETWTEDDMKRVRELWQQSCLAVDEMLGVTDGDWGQW